MKKTITEETRLKMREAALKRDNTKRLLALPKGNTHWNWVEKPSKLALHKRLHRKYGPAKNHICKRCERQAHDWANTTGKYTDQLKDYAPLCRSCHVKMDKNWLKKS